MSGIGFVWLAGIRDLQWRRRRFVMVGLATALLFGITLLLSGTSESFRVEVGHVLDRIGADGYVVQTTQRGPFMSPQPFDASIVDDVAQRPGVRSAAPLVSIVQPDSYLFGFEFADQNPSPGKVFMDKRIGREVGDVARVGAAEFAVEVVTKHQTVLGGQPLVRLSVPDAQRAVFGGSKLVTSVAVSGRPESLPDGYKFMTRQEAAGDFLRPIGVVTKTIGIVSALLWLVATAVVGSVIYVSTLERLRDISVFKATGASTRDVLLALLAQSVAISIGASIVAIGVGYALAPLFPLPVSFPARSLALIPTVGLVIGLVASVAGLRRAVRVDPVVAMGSAA